MRILFVYESRVPNAEADSEVFVHTAAELAGLGHESLMVVPDVGEPDDVVTRHVHEYYGTSHVLPVRTVRAPFRQRTLLHVVHAANIGLIRSFRNYDVTYVQSLPVMGAALEAGHRVFYDHYRPFGDQLPPLQPMLRSWMARPNFVGAAMHSQFAVEAYERIGVEPDRLRAIECAYDPSRLEPALSKDEARRKVGLPLDKPIAVYTGRVSPIKGLDVVLEMARRAPDVEFVLVGSTGHGPIERSAESLSNVRIVPWQHFSETAPYLFAADVLLMPPSSDPLKKFGRTVLPLKTFLYLGARRPILAGDNPDIRGLLQHRKNAWLVPPGDLDAALDGLRKIVTDDALRQSLVKGASASAAQLTWASRAKRVEAFLQERMSAPARGAAANSSWSHRRCASETLGWLRQGVTQGSWVYRPTGTRK